MPDIEYIPNTQSHLHVYHEMYHDKYAKPAPVDMTPTDGDPLGSLTAFARFCNIILPSNWHRRIGDDRLDASFG